MRHVYIFIILMVSIKSFSQKNKEFKFKIADITENYYNSSEFTYSRIYYNDSVFKEVGLFGVNKRNSKTDNKFKKAKGKWYIRQKDEWNLFFNNGESVKTIVFINGDKYGLQWTKLDIVDSTSKAQIYKLNTIPIGFKTSGSWQYYFTQLDGVIAVQTHHVFLVREDKKEVFKNYH